MCKLLLFCVCGPITVFTLLEMVSNRVRTYSCLNLSATCSSPCRFEPVHESNIVAIRVGHLATACHCLQGRCLACTSLKDLDVGTCTYCAIHVVFFKACCAHERLPSVRRVDVRTDSSALSPTPPPPPSLGTRTNHIMSHSGGRQRVSCGRARSAFDWSSHHYRNGPRPQQRSRCRVKGRKSIYREEGFRFAA